MIEIFQLVACLTPSAGRASPLCHNATTLPQLSHHHLRNSDLPSLFPSHRHETVKVKALGHDRARYGWKTASLVLLEEIRYETKDETGESTKAT